MVTVADGRFELPENLFYTRNQHVYLDKAKNIIGLDQIGFAFLKNPKEITLLSDKEIKVGEPFVSISTERGITTLDAPCSGKIKSTNPNALAMMETDTYTRGFILELATITDVSPSLITGADVEKWAQHEVRSLLHSNYSFKVVEIGDSAVGKTAVKVRFTDDYFKKDLKTTLGVDFGSKEIKCEYMSNDILFNGVYRFTAKMNVWDAAGQAHYEKIRGMYYRDAKGALLVYDVTNPESFKNLDKWVAELEENLGRKVPVLLVGNKIDLERKVSREEAVGYAMKNKFQFVECSAKTGEGVEDAFRKLAVEIYKIEENLE
jgi:small GTP-binding protein